MTSHSGFSIKPTLTEAAELVPENPAEEEKWREWYSTRSDQPDRLDLAVIDRSDGGCVGEAVLNE